MPFKLNENQVVTSLRNFIMSTDADALAIMLGVCFGGECHVEINETTDETEYIFKPNEAYMGEFGEVTDEVTEIEDPKSPMVG